jgi:hypothetical protein
MSSTVRGFKIRDLTPHGKGETGRRVVNFAKATPQTTTGNLFTVVGSVQVNGLFGVVSTALGAVAQHLTIGADSLPAAIAAANAVALNANVVGSVFVMPLTLGGALPAPVTASGAAAACEPFVLTGVPITLTSDASTTGNITWVLSYTPVYPKGGGTVTAV